MPRALRPRGALVLALLAAVVMSAGCSRGKSEADAKPKAEKFSPVPVHSVTYVCDNNARIVAQFSTMRMSLRLSPELVLSLKRSHADSGLKYSYADYEFSIHGERATLTLPGNRPLHCQAQAGDSQ